eukprot:c4453_g1_i1.p1 GENE.c4453_g1_i1~~c4453_g1_i1.p1  ORF type:complete len:235 (-),score=2.20 c4453_g1_i1:17-721(-)
MIVAAAKASQATVPVFAADGAALFNHFRVAIANPRTVGGGTAAVIASEALPVGDAALWELVAACARGEWHRVDYSALVAVAVDWNHLLVLLWRFSAMPLAIDNTVTFLDLELGAGDCMYCQSIESPDGAATEAVLACERCAGCFHRTCVPTSHSVDGAQPRGPSQQRPVVACSGACFLRLLEGITCRSHRGTDGGETRPADTRCSRRARTSCGGRGSGSQRWAGRRRDAAMDTS